MTIVYIEPCSKDDFEVRPTGRTLPKTVVFSKHSHLNCAIFGAIRQVESMHDNRTEAFGETENPYELHIEGYGAECALARVLEMHLRMTINTFKTVPDVGEEETRCRLENGNELVLRKDDFEEPFCFRRYWLITGRLPRKTVRGWVRPIDVKEFLDPNHPDKLRRLKPCYGRNQDRSKPPTRWFVPDICLHTIVPHISKSWEKRDPQLKLQTIEPDC